MKRDYKAILRERRVGAYRAVAYLRDANHGIAKTCYPLAHARRYFRDVMGADPLAARAEFAAKIRAATEDGKVAVVSSGMDCDGGAWSGRTSIEPAVPFALERAEISAYEWADGPLSFGYTTPSAAAGIRAESRDLGMEAYENGHPHVYRW